MFKSIPHHLKHKCHSRKYIFSCFLATNSRRVQCLPGVMLTETGELLPPRI